MTHNRLILNHLESGNSITPLEALEKYGCFRLSGRIKELRNEGYPIKTEIIKENNKRFAKYYMVSEN